MLENRDYMRDSAGPRGRQPLSVQLMIVLTVVFALQMIDQVYVGSPARQWLALSVWGLSRGCLWQFITFQFLHGGLLHLAGNLIGLWFFGRWVEEVLGRRRFALVYFGGGVLGGLLQAILMIASPSHFGTVLFGASAGVYALIAVFARLEADSEIRLNFILPIKASALLWILGGVALFFTLVPADRGVAHAAHLGGLIAGIGFVKLGWHHDYVRLPWEGWLEAWRRRRIQPITRKSARSDSNRWDARRQAPDAAEMEGQDFISREIDPILDKISAHGIHSLTERERKILEAARGKMAKR